MQCWVAIKKNKTDISLLVIIFGKRQLASAQGLLFQHRELKVVYILISPLVFDIAEVMNIINRALSFEQCFFPFLFDGITL